MNNSLQRPKQDVECGQVLHFCGWLAGSTDIRLTLGCKKPFDCFVRAQSATLS